MCLGRLNAKQRMLSHDHDASAPVQKHHKASFTEDAEIAVSSDTCLFVPKADTPYMTDTGALDYFI